MSVSVVSLSRLLRCSLSTVGRSARCACMRDPTASGVRWNSTRLDMDGSGRPATWDSFGIWDNRIEEPILLPPSIRYGTPIPHISVSKVGCASHIGRRRDNEDRFQVNELTHNILYFALFDGHGGPQAADFCHKHMEQHIRDGIELVVASVGDSRALLCRKGKARKLTDDHTPERKDEKHSVGQANVNGRLAMTRSIGDFDLKKTGVIAEPETTQTLLQHAHDSFLVLTTDGINFIMSNQEICDVINQCHDPTEAANVIAELALQYGSEDNSTVIVVPFGAWGKHQNAQYTYDMSRNFASMGRWS
ncbi:Protein phosphatase 1K, mitochondrial [Labeo rohita]|uniref:Protein phosphatase 1K, mitochondrial n=1 Tax=Labeo rohita TaxID=84645 RepID=A0ABQ8LGE1_LABRO|nr:Protein phosphatase 1K, mitochondrial [Labeo rohita]